MRFQRRFSAALMWLVVGVPTLATAADGPGRTVVFILDCSKSMNANLDRGEALREVNTAPGITHLDAARDTLKAALTDLSAEGGHQVAVWLYGHRIAWEDADEPNLIEQTEYLEKSLGFKALENLLPGDDVELIRPLDRLEPRDLAGIFALLDVVQPWGEDPLYLSIVRALDNLGRDATAANASIVVITDGENRQWLGRFQTSKDDVLDAAGRRPVPVHMIVVGAEANGGRQQQAELRQIAARSRGSVRQAETSERLMARVENAMLGRPSAEKPAGLAAGPGNQPLAAEALKPVADATAGVPATIATPAPRHHRIEGYVRYYKSAVRKAKVVVEGSERPPVVTDEAGRFTLDEIPPGHYKVKIEGVFKNVIRRQSADVTVEPTSDELLTLDIELE